MKYIATLLAFCLANAGILYAAEKSTITKELIWLRIKHRTDNPHAVKEFWYCDYYTSGNTSIKVLLARKYNKEHEKCTNVKRAATFTYVADDFVAGYPFLGNPSRPTARDIVNGLCFYDAGWDTPAVFSVKLKLDPVKKGSSDKKEIKW